MHTHTQKRITTRILTHTDTHTHTHTHRYTHTHTHKNLAEQSLLQNTITLCCGGMYQSTTIFSEINIRHAEYYMIIWVHDHTHTLIHTHTCTEMNTHKLTFTHR